ncbi:diguanylate cyclase [Bradyrhizobium jicamae]|uniref:diguanylate cyclase n=1 Tax=Bradyrhizobium jicamae TaxID=280332 RepID=A0A0R3KLD3_9BRAD|nr:sensor domain-containing diguanylate cyclase [Bradyrhizobium jicamae]KRQ96427.1 diguanylate cyclase [Bradyrhizobium jicamae]
MRNLLQKLANRLHVVEDHLTVQTQIAAAVALMSVLLIGALAGGAAFVSYRNTASLVNSSLATVASTTSGRLDRFMAERQLEMNLFSRLQPLQKLWQDNPVELRRALEQLQATFSDLAWIGFADVNGKVVAATGGLLEGASVAARPWFKEGLQRLAIGDVHEAVLLASLLAQREDGEPYRFVDLAFPVKDSSGKLLGVLGGHLNWDWASQLIKDVEANDGDTDTRLSIIDKNGVVLVGPDKGTTRYGGEQLANILKKRKGAFSEISGDQRMLTAFYVGMGHREYQGLNWIVTASQPTGIALAAAISSAEIILGIGAVTALIGLGLAVVISRRIARPIIAITTEADRIGRASGPTMLARQSGSVEVVQLTRALRSLLRRIGFAEERTREAELRASENALQFKDDLVKLQKMADTDYLTGLMNRRAFLAVADDTVEFCRRYKRGMATLMIDIDHFKKINDTHGHAAGDDAIKGIADIIGQSIRTTDKAARFGGEEFVVLLREIDQETAMLLAERIRSSIEQTAIRHGETSIPATVSIGVAINAEGDRDVQDMIERADQGLYVAKKTGRNRTFLMPASEGREARAA